MANVRIELNAEGVSRNLLKLLINRSLREDWEKDADFIITDNFGGTMSITFTDLTKHTVSLRNEEAH